MKSVAEFIASGILELYVLGETTDDETKKVEEMAANHKLVQDEIEHISEALFTYAQTCAVAPNPSIKAFLMATIDYTERLENGEEPGFPEIIHEQSKPSDYNAWVLREDMVLPHDFDGLHARIIGYTPEVTTAIVWIKEMAPEEVHTNEYEKFLVLEGSCDITIGDGVHHLWPGDSLSIPLHQTHFVSVTSQIPCKVILQRIAA